MTTPRLLVIDDDIAVRGMLADVLTHLGYDVDEASNGVEGVGRFDEDNYDLVLTDHLMPGMTGREVIEAVRERRPATNLIMLTGYTTDADVEALRRQGLTILAKPVNISDLNAAIQRVLNSPN
jgi:two-component system, NtrC family, response regulator AtoC